MPVAKGDKKVFMRSVSDEDVWLEMDVPPDFTETGATTMSQAEVDKLERQSKAFNQTIGAAGKLHHLILKDKAFKFIVACVVALFVLYIVDVVLLNTGLKNSVLLNGLFELIKFILSALVGFAFSSEANSREDK